MEKSSRDQWVELIAFISFELYLYTLGILVLFIYLVFLIIFIPTLIWRPIVRALASYLRPDLADILSCTSSTFAQVDDQNYAKSVIVVQCLFKGVLDYEKLVKQFQKEIIEYKDDKKGCLYYPELQQYITNWAGYKFWKWEENFSVRNHIHLINDNNLSKTSKDLHTISQDLLSGTFPKNKSPWDITLLPGILDDGVLSTQFLFRFHHALGDGFSILFLLQRLLGRHKVNPPHKPRPTPVSPGYFLRFPYRMVRMFGELSHNTACKCLWKIPEEEKSKVWSFCVGKGIPISTILQVKNHTGVSFTAVVFALLCGGLCRYINRHEKHRGIMTMPAVITAPINPHPKNQLVNKFSFAMAQYPVGNPDAIDRLKAIHNNFEGLRDSPISIIGYLILILHGSNFNWIGRLLGSYRYAPTVTTYFPIGKDEWILLGCPVTRFSFYLRIHQGQQGAMFCISTFQNELIVTPVFNSSLLSNEQVAELCQDIEQEAKVLLCATKSNNGNKKLL